MLARALLISFQQALRSIALTLFPLAFIAMLAWATAGSSTGNTTDPIRASLWLWLGAHLVPFHLHLLASGQAGTLSLLPIGGLILPLIAMRSGYSRTDAVIASPKGSRILFGFWYILIAELLAYAAQGNSVKPSLIFTPIYISLWILIASLDYSQKFLQRLALPFRSIELLLGVSALAAAISMVAHFSIVKSLTTVISPGWIGGVLYLFLQILYLPNLAIYALSYFIGLGFHLGSATLVAPMQFQLHQIPAISLMGALPTGRHPMYLLAIIFIILVPLLIFRNEYTGNIGTVDKLKALFSITVFTSLILMALSFFSSGSLITHALNPVGLTFWGVATAFAAIEGALAILLILIPAAFVSLLARRK